jgi:hypothetical protein
LGAQVIGFLTRHQVVVERVLEVRLVVASGLFEPDADDTEIEQHGDELVEVQLSERADSLAVVDLVQFVRREGYVEPAGKAPEDFGGLGVGRAVRLENASDEKLLGVPGAGEYGRGRHGPRGRPLVLPAENAVQNADQVPRQQLGVAEEVGERVLLYVQTAGHPLGQRRAQQRDRWVRLVEQSSFPLEPIELFRMVEPQEQGKASPCEPQ